MNRVERLEFQPSLEEQAFEIWRKMEWKLPGEFTNKETIFLCFEEISKEFPEFFGESSPKKLMAEITDKKSRVLSVYREIFPKENNHEPFYHNISEDEQWGDHVGYVMASSARLFLGVLRMQKKLLSSESDELNDEKKEFEEKFGPEWLSQKLTLTDLIKSLDMALLHEAGEWWTRGIWTEVLEMQRAEVEKWRKGELNADEVKTVEQLSLEFKRKNILGYYRKIWKTRRLMKKMEQIVGKDGMRLGFDSGKFTEFDVYFEGGSARDVDFMNGDDEEVKDPILRILTAIFKGADFSQSIAPYYLTIQGIQNMDAKIFGSLALFLEFVKFRPNALVQQGWHGPGDVSVGDFYYKNLFKKYVDECIIRLFIISAERNTGKDSSKIRNEEKSDYTDEDFNNSNIKKLRGLSGFFAHHFNR